ncbi:MAG: hypothetical protein ACOCUV_01115 [bacterium]
MLKLLIISLHFPPDNIIAARRSEAYARHFYKFGVYPTIVTDIVEKVYDENGKWVAYKNHGLDVKPIVEEYETYRVIRLPRFIRRLQRMQKFVEQVSFLSPFFTLTMNLLGHFDMHLIGHYKNYKRYLANLLKQEKFDCILAIDSPHYHVKLAYELNAEFNIPYICDFRDLIDNQILGANYKPGKSKNIINRFKLYFFKKWLKDCIFITAASHPIAAFYANISGVPGYEITNGFEPLADNPAKKNEVSEFVLSYTGRLYQNQDWEILAKGVKNFIINENPSNFKVIFAGVRKDAKEIMKMISQYIPEENLVTYMWLEKKETEEIQAKTSVFVLASWSGTVGVYSGKLFEYLGARKPILFAPGDKCGVVDQLLLKTKAGITANTPEEVCTFITLKYNEWREAGQVRYDGIEKEINKYTREEQVNRMAGLIKKYLKNGK